MTNFLVVIGSVTAKQYKDARLELFRLGMRTEIARLAENSVMNAFDHACDLVMTNPDDESLSDEQRILAYEYRDEDGFLHDVNFWLKFIPLEFGFDPCTVVGLVLPQHVWVAENIFDQAAEAFSNLTVRRIVRPGGRVEVA